MSKPNGSSSGASGAAHESNSIDNLLDSLGDCLQTSPLKQKVTVSSHCIQSEKLPSQHSGSAASTAHLGGGSESGSRRSSRGDSHAETDDILSLLESIGGGSSSGHGHQAPSSSSSSSSSSSTGAKSPSPSTTSAVSSSSSSSSLSGSQPVASSLSSKFSSSTKRCIKVTLAGPAVSRGLKVSSFSSW